MDDERKYPISRRKTPIYLIMDLLSTSAISLSLLDTSPDDASRMIEFHLLRVQPDGHKPHPAYNRCAQSHDPHVCSADRVAPGPFIVCKVPHCDVLLVDDRGQEWPLVVEVEGEDPVLIRHAESGREYGRLSGGTEIIRLASSWIG